MKKIIFARHQDSKEFLFEVPESMNPEKGDLLLVNTMKGNALATATSDVIEIDVKSVGIIVEKVGAYLPLKKVITYANSTMMNYLKELGARSMAERVNDAISYELSEIGFASASSENTPY